MKVEQSAFLCQEISEILLGCYLGDLAKGLVFRIVSGRLGTAFPLLFKIDEPPLGNSESLIDGLVQVRMLILAQQMIRLMADDNVPVSGNADLDVDHRRDGSRRVLGPLVDPYPTGNQPIIELLQISNPGADFFLGAFGTFDIMK